MPKTTKKKIVVKKTVKKQTKRTTTATKKKSVSTKKSTRTLRSVSSKKKEMRVAPVEQAFWVYFGPILHTLIDLEQCFDIITEEQFAYHVNKEKNDFAKWTGGTLREKDLALELKKCKNKNTAQKTVRIYIKKHY
jgi:uncharacterized protein YabN with tetrapyrrole methylase and pyrophosphatase domain